ncbi:MAG: signal peptide peptidase SppA [Candidatus Melainabacteria bacterium HGW-Melainabacteria-1]|nr:MAG: signal peptide peptidase SppA [Candidatus Melainabacteria bacterium HGW-Melainabacteria-1]
MSLRPFRHYITLSVDMHHQEDTEWRDSAFVYSVDITLGNDISLYGAADNEKNISFGIKVPIDISAPGARSTLIADYYGTTRREGPGLSTFGFSIAGEIFRSPIRTPRQLLKIELKGEMSEIPSQRIMGADQPVYFDVLNAIAAAGDTPGIEGIILTIDGPRMGIARIQEVREELNRFRRKGKKVYAILLTSGNSDYYLATAADTIYFNPAETFTLTGLSSQVYFYRELLDKIGIKFESVRKGRYKFFNEAFTSRVMSRDYRESLIQLLTDLNSQFTGAITSSRNMSPGVLDDMFRRAMITSQEAVDAGFVDVLMYPDPAERDIVRISGGNCRITNLREFIFFPRRPVQWGPVPEIAIIHVGGSIVRGNTDSPGPFSPDATGDETYKKLLGEALSSRSVAGAVIRVNSGGGSAVASDLMRHYLLEIKSRFNKPVVFSFGDIAASGGYYIACTGDGIFASPGTITGSIGVISGKVSLKALYEKIGVNREVVKMAEQSDIFTEARDMTDAEKDIFQKSVEAIYRRFTQVVSEGRKIESAKMDGLAEGRVFTGSQAMAHRLVDSMGGLQAAVEQVLRLTGTTGAYSVKHLPRHRVPLGAELFSTIAAGSTSKLPDSLLKAASRITEIELLYDRNESALYLYPYKVIIK